MSNNGDGRPAITGDNDRPPGKFDVLFGPGAPLREHPGNKRYREYVNEYVDLYDDTPRNDRSAVADRATHLVSDGGRVRFFIRDKGGPWRLATVQEIRKTVMRSLRELRKEREKRRAKEKRHGEALPVSTTTAAAAAAAAPLPPPSAATIATIGRLAPTPPPYATTTATITGRLAPTPPPSAPQINTILQQNQFLHHQHQYQQQQPQEQGQMRQHQHQQEPGQMQQHHHHQQHQHHPQQQQQNPPYQQQQQSLLPHSPIPMTQTFQVATENEQFSLNHISPSPIDPEVTQMLQNPVLTQPFEPEHVDPDPDVMDMFELDLEPIPLNNLSGYLSDFNRVELHKMFFDEHDPGPKASLYGMEVLRNGIAELQKLSQWLAPEYPYEPPPAPPPNSQVPSNDFSIPPPAQRPRPDDSPPPPPIRARRPDHDPDDPDATMPQQDNDSIGSFDVEAIEEMLREE